MQRRELFVPVSAGELLDKITILEIKAERISEPAKLEHVHEELHVLGEAASELDLESLADDVAALRRVNEELWDIEDELRRCESESRFDDHFVALARSVYLRNDERAAIKRRINERAGSRFVEEKSYAPYRTPPYLH